MAGALENILGMIRQFFTQDVVNQFQKFVILIRMAVEEAKDTKKVELPLGSFSLVVTKEKDILTNIEGADILYIAIKKKQ